MSIAGYPGRLKWHHRAQTEWTEGELWFWFMRFQRSYDPQEVLPELHKAGREVGLYSFASYELLGFVDVMARTYIPAGEASRVEEAVIQKMTQYRLDVAASFKVGRVVRHWPWARKEDGSGQIWWPDDTVMAKRPSLREVEVINELARIAEEPETIGISDEEREILDRFLENRLVTLSTRDRGIKLVMYITAGENPTGDIREEVRRQLERTLDHAGDLLNERSLYQGERQDQALFLLMCRVDFPHFHKIRKEFIQDVRDIVGTAGARTMTYVVASDDLRCYNDGLPEAAVYDLDRDYLKLLKAPETQSFEAKGSALAPLMPWLKEGSELRESKKFFQDSVLKTVAGFLNSGGGLIVIGALETDKFDRNPEVVERVLDRFPSIGPHTCIGLMDPFFVEKGWDRYARHIEDLLKGQLSPHPGVLANIRREEVEGRDVAVIDVEHGGDQEYRVITDNDGSIYYGRINNKTEELQGDRIRQHKEQVRRRLDWSRRSHGHGG